MGWKDTSILTKRWIFSKVRLFVLIAFSVFATACTSKVNEKQPPREEALFKKVPVSYSGVDFRNHIQERFEYFENFSYAYNGGGTAIGDINNDGLQDIFFTGNEVDNRLYLNKGALKFQDITASSGITTIKGWNNGVVMVDINYDGLLDIYVCRGGWRNTDASRKNLLFINQGDSTFKEEAELFGIADAGFSTQASFFDFDNDGDLDLYVVNRPNEFMMPISETLKMKADPPEVNRDKLYENDNGRYIEVGEQMGITKNFGYGLGVVTADVNKDGFVDIYVTNDFDEHDYLYLNEQGKYFRESIKTTTQHIALYAMGVDIMDINNDGLEDIFVTEMQPSNYQQAKISMPSMDIEGFNTLIDQGFYYQYMHNMLQLNQGGGVFSEISKLTGIDKTDWSWAGLASDLDNDGKKDLLVTNGFRRDIFDNDVGFRLQEFFMKNKSRYRSAQELIAAKGKEIIELYKPLKERNRLFKNQGDLRFKDVSESWGFDDETFSNGASLGDLDNDGDLDVIINNLEDTAFIYENTSNDAHNYLRVKLKGPSKNTTGLGVKISIWYNEEMQYQEFKAVRGYLSSQEQIVHFGLSELDKVDSLEVIWPGGQRQILHEISANQVLDIDFVDAKQPIPKINIIEHGKLFAKADRNFGIDFEHVENQYNDFEKELLLPHRYSQFGPGMAKGDINGDGLDDLYVCGAKGQSGALYVQTKQGSFSKKSGPWDLNSDGEELSAVFFDANGDGKEDLFVVNGGNEVVLDHPSLKDKFYLNTGNNTFKDASNKIPQNAFSGAKVRPGDYDGDGDLDLFIAGRVHPGQYPNPASSYLYENNNGTFVDVTDKQAKELKYIGLTTDAMWVDYDNDGDKDLKLVGEWMPITIFKNIDNRLVKADPKELGLENTEGWWYSLAAGDFDKDGDVDLIAGNLGLNYKYKATISSPFEVFGADFDHNGKNDIILGFNDGGEVHPLRGKECSSQQLPGLKNKFKTYADFSTVTVKEMVGDIEFENALHLVAKTFATTYFENNGTGTFKPKELPRLAQFSSVNAIEIDDFNNDGNLDVILAGNLYTSEIETTRNDSSYGAFLEGDGRGGFKASNPNQSGAYLGGDIKDICQLKINGKQIIVVAKNDEKLDFIKVNAPPREPIDL